jgi:hypothetical protein
MNQKRFRDLAVTVDISTSDKTRLKAFMQHELSYYNALVGSLGPRCRTFPEHLLALHKDWEKLFSQIAYEGKSLKNLERAKPDAVLTEGQEPFRKFLVGLDSQGKRFLNDRMYSIMSAAAAPATVHPVVRRNMASTILSFYKDQAGRVINRNEVATETQDVYKKAPEMLLQHDMVTKRHLQLPRSTLYSVTYDATKDATLIENCYSENPIAIPGHDLTSNNHWNYIIIHQEPGIEVLPNSNWVVDIKHSMNPYLIKYYDVEQPKTGQIFNIAKRKSY